MPTYRTYLYLTLISIVFGATLGSTANAANADTATTHVTTGVPPGFKSATADLGDIKIHYVIGGSGPPLLLVHGWPETWYEWRKMMPGLAAHYTVIAPDLRGMGDSSLAASGYDKKTLGQDMYRLMTKLGYTKATLIGHDWGAPVAYAYAAQYRDAVEQLVMIEGAPMGSWLPTTDLLWFFPFLRIPGYAEQILPGREREFLRYFYDNADFHVVPGAIDATSIDVYSRAYARPDRMMPTYGLYRSIPQDVRDTDEFAKRPLSIPVLAIGAERGAGELVAQSARKLATHVTPVLFKKTGHFIPEERPEPLLAIVLQFLHAKPVVAVWQPQGEGAYP